MNKILILTAILILSSCLTPAQKKSHENTQPVKPIESIFWDTSGGGECKFSVKQESGSFIIAVTSWSFQAMNKKIVVKESDAAVFKLLTQIFNKSIDLKEDVFVPKPGALTGTWTSISIQYSETDKVKIEHIQTRGVHNLTEIYQFVESKVK